MPTNNVKDKVKQWQIEIEQQKKALNDSLRYARNIQNALFPSINMFRILVPNSFLLFHPKEIVSGDFYWATRKNNKVVVAAGDCTGHGVPGAFMSILGITFLNSIVSGSEQVPAANIILNMLRENIMKALNQGDEIEGQRDGMDMALCIIDYANNTMQFAGANNALYLIRDSQLHEFQPDRMPIGIDAAQEVSFKNNTIPLMQNDMIYMFTDGFADQFGGPLEKKFKYPQFRKLLNKVHSQNVDKQPDLLWQAFNNWRGKIEQVDDILIIGIQIK
jgi:serine phosphatase RsbU (regulator of sigma subunit)